RRPEKRSELLAAGRLSPGGDTRGVDHVRVRRIHLHLGEVVGALGDAGIVADPGPALSRVIGAVEKALLLHLHRGEEARSPGRRDAAPDPPEPVVLEIAQAFRQPLPACPAVDRLVEATARAGELAVLPGRLPRFPAGGVDDRGIRRIDHHVGVASVRILVEDALVSIAYL